MPSQAKLQEFLEFYVFSQPKGSEVVELVTTSTYLHMEKVTAFKMFFQLVEKFIIMRV